MLFRKFPYRDEVLAAVTVIMVIGSLTLAAIDEKSCPQFIELTKFAVSTYIRLLIPQSRSNDTDSNSNKIDEQDEDEKHR